jgi:hypothetical protein
MRKAAAFLGVLIASALSGCGGDDTITIELDEVGGSGITGTVELTPAGENTRVTVTKVEGGTITGARVMGSSPCPEIDDKHPITPPAGVINVPFELVRSSKDDLTAAFLRNGRYVACGTT